MTKITVASGDGIGPEIMQATLNILKATEINLQFDIIEIGKKAYLDGHNAGIPLHAWKSIKENKVLLKAPITTPQGGGYKSLNVTLRKTLGLAINLRPCRAYHPFVATKFPKLDIVIVRENEEDLYAGIEYRQTDNIYQALKLISLPSSLDISKFAFDYAQKFNRKRVTCMMKDNIMKFTDGIFHKAFKQVATLYSKIVADSFLIDIGAARVATEPENFDVIVTENLYGDILSDIVAQLAGSVGLAGSANLGKDIAMFEAIHGSAPDIAGKNIANPSGILNAAIMMLVHIGESKTASIVENAWLKTIEDGIHTKDIYNSNISKQCVGTKEFSQAIISNLGNKPKILATSKYENLKKSLFSSKDINFDIPVCEKKLVGSDIFINFAYCGYDDLAKKLISLAQGKLELKLISKNGVKVWPGDLAVKICNDHWCCRFVADDNYTEIKQKDVLDLLNYLHDANLEVIKIENLYTFDGKRGFSLAQGE